SQSAIRSPQFTRPTWIFTTLAALSLLFAFGTPLYAILFYGLPGWSQLHSPFRWVFPFTVSMAVLGGIGLERLLVLNEESRLKIGRISVSHHSLFFILASSAILAGLAALAAVAVSYFVPAPFIALGQRIVDGSDLAQMSFADGYMFWGYQSMNLVKFGVFAVLSGAWLRLVEARRRRGEAQSETPAASSHLRLFASSLPFLAAVLVAADLFAIHGTFNPATDPALSPLVNVPPVVQFIEERESGDDATMRGGDEQSVSPPLRLSASLPPFRFTTFDIPGSKTFNANVGMYYGWHDLRGYDSIIPRQYVELMNKLGDQSGELLYNRIAPLYAVGPNPYAVLNNPLLDLLNVKYILTETVVPSAGWQRIYADGVVKVYENLQAFPRAFIVPEAQVYAAEEQPLLSADLRNVVFIEEMPTEANALTRASPQLADATISRYTSDEVFVDINLSDRGWLVLSDAWFPGWKAFVRPFGGDESQETELTIHRANGALRTVYLPEQGQWTVRFVYSPMSFKVGLYVSFLAVMACALLLLWWLWGRYYRPDESGDEVRTVAKNSLVPMALNMANKAIDFAFALLYVRLLGPEGTGQYAFVVTMYGFFEIVSRYGLGTLLTRDVAADKNQSSRYLTNVLGLRTILWLASLPVLALVTGGFRVFGGISMAEVQAIAIFAAAMLFANWADALSSLFYAFEKMEYPAGLSSAAALLKVTLGALVLL
ncbi:MAG: oligosaccharide flippase family protein, partial [Caldilineaceae bacterium]|nr:oligosaccharide flippase family protein [Caldilineaceae bacterium]